METTLSIFDLFSVAVAVLALLLGLMAYSEATAPKRRKESERHHHRPKPTPPPMSEADRRKMAVRDREHRNFMDYDGGEQPPIDESTILADSGT